MKDNPDIKLNRSLESVKEIISTQKSIINNAKSYVKVGGELIYSTCSILSEENDGVVENFLLNNKDFKVLDIEPKLYGLKTKYGVQFMPNVSLGAGFYAVKLKRLK
jgi:16S rRNA (cytosine967-C5)-methyltransferase